MSKRTEEPKASRTAGYTCFSRACANWEKDVRFRGPDDLAEVFLPPFAKVIQRHSVLRWLFIRRLAPAGIYEYVLARTKAIDGIFVQALEQRFSQIVVLGAGFDTRALRFQKHNRGTKIFELDTPATQQPKMDILSRRGIEVPKELAFVPIDFNVDSLSEVLFRAGYQKEKRDLFVWEGVTMYLTPDSVDRTLDSIGSIAAAGSLVVFDYIYASVLRRENRFYGEKGIFKTVSKAGESWTFGLEQGEMDNFLTKRGFKVVAHYGPADLEQRYLTAEDGKRFGRINETHGMVISSLRSRSDQSGASSGFLRPRGVSL
jgi:methyltransferase (TIGR00027 family)